jgi:hypothetical protein
MTDPSFIPEADRELLVVYRSREQADAGRDALRRAGVPDGEIHIDREPDRVASLRAEMHEELTEAWVVPNAAVIYTKESARGLLTGSVIGIGIGLVLAAVAAIPDYAATYPTRFVVCALVAVAFGATIGMVAGAGTASKRPGQLPAAERGTLLRVERDTPEIRRLLAELHPIRMDELAHDDLPIATVVTEGADDAAEGIAETAQDQAANVTGDDYHPERQPEADHRRQPAGRHQR